MFQINSYLQFRNTPDKKPRVLREGVDYNSIILYTNKKWLVDRVDLANQIANLSDCRPLLSVEIDGKVWTEGDVFESKFGFLGVLKPEFIGIWITYPESSSTPTKILGSFFDDPAKYSKLLWNCSEEGGWQKVFKLLNIEL